MNTQLSKIKVYSLALQGVREIYLLIKILPLSKDFSLIDQIKRASTSICANIAEGYGRRSKKEFVQFLSIALGSTNEVIAFLDVISIVYPTIKVDHIQTFYEELGKQIYSLRRKVQTNE